MFGEYLLKLSIGTPTFDIVAIADTGSDLIWTQCKPCSQCYPQTAPLFDPSGSSTYKTVACWTSQCGSLGGKCSNSSCQYSVSYGVADQLSFSNGDFATDTLVLPSTTGRPIVLPTMIFGCGHNNVGGFSDKTSGIIGLGRGVVSLVSQVESTIDGKFSYCLLPISKIGNSSKLNFGSNAIVSGSGVVSTPLIKKDKSTFYFLTLEGISVGTEMIPFTGSAFGTNNGNIIIDSGTTMTLVPEDFYLELESAVASGINAKKVDSPTGLGLCYDTSTNFAVPNITVHFTGAHVQLQPLNTFILFSPTIACFTFSPDKEYAIYGNTAQMNFLVGYDILSQTISFMPTDCSSH